MEFHQRRGALHPLQSKPTQHEKMIQHVKTIQRGMTDEREKTTRLLVSKLKMTQGEKTVQLLLLELKMLPPWNPGMPWKQKVRLQALVLAV